MDGIRRLFGLDQLKIDDRLVEGVRDKAQPLHLFSRRVSSLSGSELPHGINCLLNQRLTGLNNPNERSLSHSHSNQLIDEA